MVNVVLPLFLFFFQTLLLFFISRATLNQLFYFLRIFINEEKLIFTIVSLIFLPGTIVHELSHFFAAIVLFLRVRHVEIFPSFEGNEIKLGHVLYEKKDFLRSILVGVAPIVAGLFFFFLLSFFQLFPHQNFWLNLFFAYLIFAVSSTMFSSKKDLVDIAYLIPLIFIVGGMVYIFDIKLDFILKNHQITEGVLFFLKKINFYLTVSLSINLFLIAFLKLLRRLFKN